MRTIQLHESWLKRLDDQFEQPYMQKLRDFLLTRKKHRAVIYPPGAQIFNAMNSTPFDQVRVVILGQDPYHGPGQAHGMACVFRYNPMSKSRLPWPTYIVRSSPTWV